MPASHAHVPTTRARRYLAQLGSHSGQMARLAFHQPRRHGSGGAPPAARPIDWSDTSGIIDFGGGRCTLQATGEALTLHAEADDPDQLQRIQDGIGRRVERIGRRDRLTVTWHPALAEPAPQDPAAIEPAGEHRAASAIIDALTAPAGRADPFPLYATAHELGPVSAITDGWFLVCGYDAVSQVLRHPGFGLPDPAESRPGDGELSSLSRSILRANPPDHPRMRSLISQVFTPRRTAALQPAIEAAVDALLDRLAEAGADGQPVDFMDRFAFQLPVTVICELLGVPGADRDRFRPLAADLTQALELSAGPAGPADPGPAAAAARELAGYFTALIAQRRAHPADDLIGALVAACDADDSRLSEEELLANLILLLVAGFETTTSLLGNGLALLFDRPETAAALRSGSLAVSAFIEEVLRYDSPVQLITRQARAENLSVAGRPVPAGSQLILLIGAANRDPARYVDPGRFDPARTDVRPLSFGGGPHICLGNSLARLEAAVAFPRLLARFPMIGAASGPPAGRRDRLVLRGYETLPVVVASGTA
jgi:cytochrome P450